MSPVNDIEIKIKREVWNERYYPFIHADQAVQVLYGGASSGKSVFLAQRDVKDLLAGDRNFLVVRKVAKTLRKSVFAEMKKIILAWGLRDLFDIRESDLTITCKRNRRQAVFCGLDDVEKLKSITPENGVFTDIRIEEATETSRDDIKALVKRMRGPASVKKRLVLSFNPIFKSHWIYGQYFEGTPAESRKEHVTKNLLIVHGTYKDNRFLTADDVDALENETDPYYHSVYTLGRWGVLGDVIFKNWQIADLADIRKTTDVFYNGLDFGFASDPAAANVCGLNQDKKEIYIFAELHEHGLTNDRLAAEIKDLIARQPVFCDCAEPKSIAELNNHHVNAIGVKKGKDSLLHGIQWLQQYSIFVDPSCQHTINELQVYQWRKDKDGNTVKQPLDKFNHHIDAIRYAFEDTMLACMSIGDDFGGVGRSVGAQMDELDSMMTGGWEQVDGGGWESPGGGGWEKAA